MHGQTGHYELNIKQNGVDFPERPDGRQRLVEVPPRMSSCSWGSIFNWNEWSLFQGVFLEAVRKIEWAEVLFVSVGLRYVCMYIY